MKQKKKESNYVECNIRNPYNEAPVYYCQSTTSTMDDARAFAQNGAVNGTVVCTGFQTKGRGRFRKREWTSSPGENLLFTLILKKNTLPFPFSCLPVITGLVLCLVCEEHFHFSPLIKWPNDILFKGKKLAGILCEAEKEDIFCGIGINCNQVRFPDHLKEKATSLCTITGQNIEVLTLCEKILFTMRSVFFQTNRHSRTDWQKETENRLYRMGDKVRVYFPGSLKKGNILAQGILYGLDPDGALLVLEQGADAPVCVIAGEIVFV